MQQHSRSGHRGASTAVLLVVGGAVAAAAWIGGHPGVAAAIRAHVVLAGIAFILSGGRGDVAAILRGGGDERQRALICEPRRRRGS